MKAIQRIHHSSATHWVGNGFPVRSVFDYNGLGRDLSPFLLLDYAPPHTFSPGSEKRGVGAHPHKGFETVTVVYQGELEHRDSSGGGGKIGPGDVQWMTAGKGIIHEEFHSEDFTRQGGILQMVQLWVNLRAKDKSAPARYQTLRKGDISTQPLPDAAGSIRVIAGSFDTDAGPAQTFSPINLWDVSLNAGATTVLTLPEGHTAAFLLLSGQVTVHEEGIANEGDLVMFKRKGTTISMHAKKDSQLLVMSGEPIEEPIVAYGPFVMNTQAEIQEAFEQYNAGEMGDLEE